MQGTVSPKHMLCISTSSFFILHCISIIQKPYFFRELIEIIKHEAKDIMETAPSETVIGNMTRRILKIVRDEYSTLQKGKQEESDLQESLQKILMGEEVDCDCTANIPALKPAIMEHIGEFLTEIETR